MQDTYLPRKITRPTLPSTILHRAGLISILQKAIADPSQTNKTLAPYKLVLLCAPAGYGKTTLLVDFTCSVPLPCCWYFLEHTDNDYVVFLRTLLASLRHVFPPFGDALEAVFTNLFTRDALSPSNIYQPAVDALCNALANEVPEHFALFLCNYEEINENELLTNLVNYLLKKLPSQVTLVIESRAIPNIEFAKLLVHDDIFGLNSDTLRFSVQEIAELARLHGQTTLTTAEAEQLVTSFDGWIAGILLGTHLGNLRFLPSNLDITQKLGSHPLTVNSAGAQKRKNLFAYIANEVFQRDTEIYNFLQAASVLQQMEVEMCNALLAITSAEELLPRLERQGLFVNSYESGGLTIYTCHPIIRDHLKTQLQQQNPARLTTLHRRAAELWHARQNYDQAIYHAFEAREYLLAAKLILDSYKQFMQQGLFDTLINWIHMLPSAVLENFPRLLLIEATISLTRGQSTVALPLLDQVLELIAHSSELNDRAEIRLLQAEINILRGKVLFQAGDYPQSQELCQQALDYLPDQEIALRAAAKMRIGICANLQGDFTSGIVHLQEAIHHWDNQPPTNQVVDILGALANTYYLIGNFALAEYHLMRALNYCEQLHDEQSKIDNLIRKGIICTHQGRYAEAETILLEALTLARSSASARRSEAYALSNLGSLYLEKELYTQALAFCEDSLILARRWGNRSLIHMTLSNMSMAHLLMGDSASALLFVEKIDIQPESEKIVSYERAWHQLTCGIIFFYQKRYTEAYTCLIKIKEDLKHGSLKREMIQALLRLAVCELALNEIPEAMNLLEQVTFLLEDNNNYKQLVLVELKWLPTLLQAVKNLPQLVRLKELLSLEGDILTAESKPQTTKKLHTGEARTSRLTILAFGEPLVLLNDQPIKRWRMAHAMELFFFLLATDRPLSKEQIITELWPEFDEQTNQTFHSTLHYLRKLLGSSCFAFQADGYHLNLAVDYGEAISYDVKEFQACREQAEQALSREDDLAAREQFLRMAALYRGDYGRPFYSDWCTSLRDELRIAYLEARRQLAQIAWRSNAYDESAEHWRHMLSIDNCLEEAHLGLMQCYARQGKRSTALRQYKHCKETLEEELGIQPGPSIQQFYLRLTASVKFS